MAPINGAQGQKIDFLSPPWAPPWPPGGPKSPVFDDFSPCRESHGEHFPAELNREQPYGESWVRHIFQVFGIWLEGLGDQERPVLMILAPVRNLTASIFQPVENREQLYGESWIWSTLACFLYLLRTYVVPGQ